MKVERSTEHREVVPQPPALSALLHRVAALCLFDAVLGDEIGGAYLALLRSLVTERSDDGASSLLPTYCRLFHLLAAEVELCDSPVVGDAWQNHLLDRIISAENPFSLKAERAPLREMGSSLLEAARLDLGILRSLYEIDGRALAALVAGRLWGRGEVVVPLVGLHPLLSDDELANRPVPPIKRKLAADPDWPSLLESLALHYATTGIGDFAHFRAFRWVRRQSGARLQGIANPDPVRLEELVEYEAERALLIQNTEQFVEGFPANNALLYGDRGTGKSSTVKALIHRFGDRGLRLVEVPKSLLEDFPRILAALRGRRERFVLFVDDLSFDEQETAYKALKALLEGSLEARPDNVVVYATSNRRHLVQERFTDRMGDDEIRRWDTHQEKLSLSDRFGITLIFSTPDQDRFIRIVESLSAARGLEIDAPDLRSRAIKWSAFQGGFSGRAARQFVDHLTGELRLGQRRSDGHVARGHAQP